MSKYKRKYHSYSRNLRCKRCNSKIDEHQSYCEKCDFEFDDEYKRELRDIVKRCKRADQESQLKRACRILDSDGVNECIERRENHDRKNIDCLNVAFEKMNKLYNEMFDDNKTMNISALKTWCWIGSMFVDIFFAVVEYDVKNGFDYDCNDIMPMAKKYMNDSKIEKLLTRIETLKNQRSSSIKGIKS